MSHLHKADICLNHAMSVGVAHTIAGEEGFSLPTAGPSTTWTKFLGFLEPPNPQEKHVSSFYAHTVVGHATTISSVVLDGKRYVWYYNPWGSDGDREKGAFGEANIPEESFKNAEASEIEDIQINVSAGDEPMLEADKIKLFGFRLKSMLINLKQRGGEDARKSDDIMDRWDSWLYQSIDEYHAMSILQLLKLATDSEHLVVIHPMGSMDEIGPQSDDGVDHETKKVLSDHGACTLWSHVYMRRVHRVMTELLGKRSLLQTEAHVLDTIKNNLPRNRFDGEKTTRLALAKHMDTFGGQKELKTILSVVYDMVPEFRERRRIRTARVKSGENPRFNSNWHVEALWKLDLVPKYVVEALQRKYTQNSDTDLKPECVAGFIEAINLVASEEAKSHPAYSEETGRIATFVFQSRLHSFLMLENFVTMLKLLISCKQEQEIDHGENERQSYSLPDATISDRVSGKAFLQEHAEMYGYGVTGSRVTQDTRKKRRRTENIHTKF